RPGPPARCGRTSEVGRPVRRRASAASRCATPSKRRHPRRRWRSRPCSGACGDGEPMSDWDTLAASVAAASRWSAVEAQRALDEVLQVNGGSLPRNDALVLAERTGWSVRQMYRWKADRDRRAELPPEDATFIERVAEWG